MRLYVPFVSSLLMLPLMAIAAPTAAQTVGASAAGHATPVEPAEQVDPQNVWLLDLSDGGRVAIRLRPDVAPKMVERIKILTRQHFYDGLTFHRVIDGFMAQGGDPKGDGTGGSTLPNVPAEFNWLPHVRGSVAAARAEDENSANSQFYIVFQPHLALDKKYTVFGRVIDGMQWVDRIEPGEPPQHPTTILHAYVAADHPPAYVDVPAPAATAPAASLPNGQAAAPKLAPGGRGVRKAAPAKK